MNALPIPHPGMAHVVGRWFAAKAQSLAATAALELAQAKAGSDPAARWRLNIPALEDAVIAADQRLMAIETHLPPLAA